MPTGYAVIIDDNITNVQVLTKLLEREGVQCKSVLDPKQVADQMSQIDRVDVIFLDLEMPGLDGYQVLNQLKRNEQFAGVPVIAYSVHVSELKVTYEHGFDGFIGKPLDSDRFPQQLARILAGERVWEV